MKGFEDKIQKISLEKKKKEMESIREKLRDTRN